MSLTAARVFDESKHPRDPGGEGGGQWIKKGTTAEGTPPKPVTSKDLRERVKERFETFSAYYARQHKMTMDQYKSAVEERMQTEVDASEIIIRTPASIAEEIATDGRFQTQFETHTSGGLLVPDVREFSEEELFGYKRDTPADARPIYGYLSASERGSLDQYGDVRWVLKNDVRSRTTFTGGDSLGQTIVPSPLDDVSYLSSGAEGHFDPLTAHTSPPGPRHSGNEWPQYWEAQIHGGVSMDDIDHVELHVVESKTTDSQEVANMLDLELQRNIDLAATLRSHGIDVVLKSVASR